LKIYGVAGFVRATRDAYALKENFMDTDANKQTTPPSLIRGYAARVHTYTQMKRDVNGYVTTAHDEYQC